MSRELMPKSGIMMPHVVVTRDAAVVGVSTVDGQAGAIDLTGKYLQKTDAAAIYQTEAEGASKDYVLDSIQPIMEGALFKADPFVDNNIPFRSAGANGVESVDMMKVTTDNSIKIGSYASSVQGVEIHSAGRLQVVDQNDAGVETKYPVYSKRYRPEIDDLPFAAIGSYVKDSKGRTIGVNRTGINSDIKQFTQKVTFQQPVTIADGVGDYDAVTVRQLRNSGGGSGGPIMSGISNFGIGDFHLRDSRAFIPAFEVVSDGQILNRADYPDLWAYAQLLTPISDAAWLADVQQRGKYSTGDGTTTFRVPDRNGVQEGSIQSLFARGDGGLSSEDGVIRQAHLPNITAQAQLHGSNVPNIISSAAGAFTAGGGNPTSYRTTVDLTVKSGASSYSEVAFNAAQSNQVYNRYPALTDEVLPRNFTGVWTIRAHGGFVAANTSWAVINQDSTLPGSGTTVNGGELRSQYLVGGEAEAEANFRARADIGGNYCARISVTNSTTQRSADLDFDETGKLTVPDSIFVKSMYPDFVDTPNLISVYPRVGFRPTYLNGTVVPDNKLGGLIFFEAGTEDSGDMSRMTLWRRRKDGNRTGEINVRFPTTSGALALQGTSGIAYKKDVVDADADEALGRILGQRLVNFVYNDDEQERVRFGIIAEEAEVIAPQYIKHNQESYEDILNEDGNKIGEKTRDRPSVDVNPIVMDLMGCVQALTKKIEAMEAEIVELKAIK